MPRVRLHQHVNPLSPYYRQAPRPVELGEVFADPQLPLHLDIGCARGRFLLRMADAEPKWNFLGIEIREPLVDEANRLAEEGELTNLHYRFCNAMLWLGRLLDQIPAELLQMVTIQFPDPWFKKRHAKRRMVTPELVKDVISKLAPNGRIFVQTDIEPLAAEIRAQLCSEAKLNGSQIERSPFEIKTERETAVEAKSLPVYRMIFEKAAAISSSSLS